MPHYVILIPKDDFEVIRSMMNDSDFPQAFEQWEERVKDQISKLNAIGKPFEEVVVKADDFASFCKNSGYDKNIDTLGMTASVIKARQESEKHARAIA